VIVADEAQEFKIPNTKISHAMKALQADFEIACTGTPVENRLLDLWNVCDVVQPGLLDSARQFMERYESRVGGEDRDLSLSDLKKKLLFQRPHAFLLRRNKSEVARLPAKRTVPLVCNMSPTEIELHQGLLRELGRGNNRASFLAVLHRFAQLYQHPAMLTGDAEALSPQELLAQSSKLREVVQKLHEIRGSREKVIIFARHRAMQGILAKVLQFEFGIPVRIINGETKMKAGSLRGQGARTRAGILREFKERPGFNLLVLSPFVAGIGLTITEANHVVHYGRWWNPAVESQATDRAYRIGQMKEVYVYFPKLSDPTGLVSPTFDERLDKLMLSKYRLAEDFLKPLPPEEEMGADLFNELRAEAASN
jgi:SNF2 family DNA or RNA helicase